MELLTITTQIALLITLCIAIGNIAVTELSGHGIVAMLSPVKEVSDFTTKHSIVTENKLETIQMIIVLAYPDKQRQFKYFTYQEDESCIENIL